FKKDRSMTYAASGVGVAAAFSAASSYLRRSAAAPVGEAVAGFSDEDRLAAQGDTTR
ncbi:MAG: hypothetical protein JWR37_5658, partial [Mycobacterium sp.]|nr:hypothetical protein [Mycobacterium sp.]